MPSRELRLSEGAGIRGGLALLMLMAAVAVFAPYLSGVPVAQPDVVGTRFLPPFATDLHRVWHFLGTDRLGRDVWTRLAFGARVSLSVGLIAVAVSTVIGVSTGVFAGVFGGRPAHLLMGFTDFALAIPRVVLLLLLAALWRPSAILVVCVLGLTGWMSIARLVYGETRALMARPFVEGAIALGAGRRRLIVRHILPNQIRSVLAAATLGVGQAITLEAGLSFLGLGVQPPAASWGNMIASGRDTVVNAPWVGAAPGIALVLVVVACTLVAEGLEER